MAQLVVRFSLDKHRHGGSFIAVVAEAVARQINLLRSLEGLKLLGLSVFDIGVEDGFRCKVLVRFKRLRRLAPFAFGGCELRVVLYGAGLSRVGAY